MRSSNLQGEPPNRRTTERMCDEVVGEQWTGDVI
jgi:hypothetical protein